MTSIQTILRYSNRKLYSLDSSSYVTLTQLLERVKNGATIQVVDHKTKNDITELTMLRAQVASKLKETKN